MATSFLDSDQLAEALGIHRDTVRRLTRTGRIPAMRLGARYRYDLDVVRSTLHATTAETTGVAETTR